jgi:unsaturated rhamnogalacturonyl hydrolase
MAEKTKDEKTGLLYHAWDCSKKVEWADPVTGLSPEFWGRSIGWVPIAILDDLDFIEPVESGYEHLVLMVTDLLKAISGYQSESGLWYQVVDKANCEGNWQETSCSCLYTAAICKAVRKGILDKDYLSIARKGFQGVIDTLTWEGEDIQIGKVCIGTGVGGL